MGSLPWRSTLHSMESARFVERDSTLSPLDQRNTGSSPRPWTSALGRDDSRTGCVPELSDEGQETRIRAGTRSLNAARCGQDYAAGGARGPNAESGMKATTSSAGGNCRTMGFRTGQRSETTSATATPELEMMNPTTLSKSSSSYRPGIQLGSGGLAYATPVSVSTSATRTSTNPRDQTRVRIG